MYVDKITKYLNQRDIVKTKILLINQFERKLDSQIIHLGYVELLKKHYQ